MRIRVVACAFLLTVATTARGQLLEKSVLDRVKDATVFIKLKAGQVQASGSGFVIKVTGDTVLVMTNRHVAAPAASELPAGAKVELSVVFRSGTPQQKEMSARLLAYDEREVRDLAVLEVRGVGSPPVPIAADQTTTESELFETMQVYALGFPLGNLIQGIVDERAASPAITVTPMPISSLRRDEANQLARIQFSGSLIQGNSGGPIVDARGRLVGVAVSRLRGEAVGFAVPPSVIAGFLAGDVGGLQAELLPPQGSNARVKVALRLVDPLNRLKGVEVRYARMPSASGSPTPAVASPGNRASFPLLEGGTSVPLAVANGAARGQLSVPVAGPADRKLMVQFVLTDFGGRISASKPVPIELPERPGMIAGTADARPKTLASWSCEVNLGPGVKMSHQPGTTTIDVPGLVPRINAPQYRLFNAPSALVRVDSDFASVVKVTNEFDPGSDVLTLPGGKKLPITFQGAGILIWQDDKNFIRFERCKGSDGRLGQIHRVLVEIYKGGKTVGIYYSKNLPELPIALAARRKGSTIQLLFAVNSLGMVIFKEIALDYDKELFVGVSASNLSKHEFQARFEEFALQGPDGAEIKAVPVSISRLDGGPVRRPDGTWVLEGATMKILKTIGNGSASPQKGMDRFGGKWTDNRQLLWSGGKMGDALALEVSVETAGRYEIKAKFSVAPDYGKVNFALDGKSLLQGKSFDFYNKELRPAGWMSLGTLPLPVGRHRFTVNVAGKNVNSAGYSFGLDEIQLVPAPEASAKK